MLARLRCQARALAALAVLAVCALIFLPGAAHAQSQARGAEQGRVVIAFLPLPDVFTVEEGAEPPPAEGPVLDRLDLISQLSLGLSSAAQGSYDAMQALLDIGQGTRVSLATYEPRRPPELQLGRSARGGWQIDGWDLARLRAAGAPAELTPGLLGSLVPGGIAYAGVSGRGQREAIAAADMQGAIASVSLGRAADIAARTGALLATYRVVVAGLPTGKAGNIAVRQLVEARRPSDLLIVMQTPPLTGRAQLLPTGVAGLAGGIGALTSSTTHLQGIVAGIDVLPTVLQRVGVRVPDTVKGQPIRVEGARDAVALTSLADRLRVVLPRRLAGFWTFLGGWLILLLVALLVSERGGRRWAMRVGALGVFWLPTVAFLNAVLRPSRLVELLLMAVLALGLGALTDRLVRFPRAPAVPALAALILATIDLALGSPLIIRSVLGPNPLFGSRFYGIGNELESALAALLLVALAALLHGRGRSLRAVATFAGGGAALALVIGAGRLGADVGGVITVLGGAAVAALLMLPGGVTKRALTVAIAAPVLGLAALAAIDLAGGGDSHFTRTVLRADGSGALWDIVARRYELAGRQAIRGFMPVVTLVAGLSIAVAIRRRGMILAPVGGDPAWRAGLFGIVGVGVAGALFNDSGPVLLLFATFIGACLVTYLRGDARLSAAADG
ncbi:unannotated protein [freshwater metagenome]|uniref:Unannotated protein n=1 Tax=freshwater metagenome TaxID=449393 RepID=A0A6J7IZU7_9ZZZZ|nr:hypothetical protein [Actinomycetota bacterium]